MRLHEFQTPLLERVKRVRGVKVAENPSPGEFQALLAQAPHGQLRGLATDREAFFWPAFDCDHETMEHALGLPQDSREIICLFAATPEAPMDEIPFEWQAHMRDYPTCRMGIFLTGIRSDMGQDLKRDVAMQNATLARLLR